MRNKGTNRSHLHGTLYVLALIFVIVSIYLVSLIGVKGSVQAGFIELPFAKSDNAYGQPIGLDDSNKREVNIDKTFLDFNEVCQSQ